SPRERGAGLGDVARDDLAERALNPLIGKSFVAYATKPHLPRLPEKTATPEKTSTAEDTEAAAR
ncbi:hypothetical protein ACLMMR_43035, partial [Streptomyces sp. NPDC000405]